MQLIYVVLRTIEIGTTLEETLLFATAMPPTAEVTDTAGVNTPSAKQRAVPNKV
jgi:hypothetical protein